MRRQSDRRARWEELTSAERSVRGTAAFACGLAVIVVAYALFHHGQPHFLRNLAVFAGIFFALFVPLVWGVARWRTRTRRYRCPQCAEKVREDALICRHCGSTLAAADDAAR
jgi:zinc ribbon protein